MTTTHTPGPWRIGKCYGAVVADVPVNAGLDNDHAEAYGGHLIAESIAVCNRPLIAAAPELLEALQRLLDLPVAKEELRYLDRGIGTATPNAAWMEARAAIVKAKGEQQ